MKNNYFESSTKELAEKYQLDVYEDILLGRTDRVLLYIDLSHAANTEFRVISGSLEIFGYEDEPSIDLDHLLRTIDFTCKYAEISGKKEYLDYIKHQLSDFSKLIDVSFPVIVHHKRVWIRISSFPIKKNAKISAVYINIVTDEMNVEELNYEKAHRDSLTGLLNKYALDYHYGLRYEFEDFHVICLDIDNLKVVNDYDGHIIGNHYLKAFSDVLRQHESEYDRFYRNGGDEFVGLFFKSEVELKKIAQEILDQTKLIRIPNSKKKITVSIGIVKSTMAEDVIRKADDVLYKVKKSGKNAYLYEKEA